MSDDPTVLGLINDKLEGIAKDQKAIATSVQKIDKTQAVDSKRLDYIEENVKELKTGQKKIKESQWNHINAKKLHYNQGYKETFPQRVWRKKGEMTLLGTVLTIITWLINNYIGG